MTKYLLKRHAFNATNGLDRTGCRIERIKTLLTQKFLKQLSALNSLFARHQPEANLKPVALARSAPRAIFAGALFFVAAAGAAPREAFARKPETYVGLLQKAALGGYDPVSYFSGEPVRGVEANQAAYKGANYFFATPRNAAKFKSNPAAYAPQYGGYCAWAVAQGKTAPGDPKLWKIVGGKLYVNYNADIQAKWERDIPGFISKADANWPQVLN